MNNQPDETEETQTFEAPQEPVQNKAEQPAMADEHSALTELPVDTLADGTNNGDVLTAEAEQPGVRTVVGDSETSVTVVAPDTAVTLLPAYTRNWVKWALAVTLVMALVAGVFAYFSLTAQRSTTSTDNSANQVARLGAAIVYTQGTVEYVRSGDWKTADGELSLSEGDKVRTGNESRVVVAFDDGSAIRLDAQSQVTLKSLAVTSVVVENERGNVYSRVTTSDTRKFDIVVDSTVYQALGTAYMTMNSETIKGVEVYHSKVSVGSTTTVNEGQSYFVKNPDGTKQEKVAQIDLVALKTNEFLKWNKAEDAKDTTLADKLGVLKDIDVVTPPAQTTPQATTPKTTQPAAVIVLRGEKTNDGILVSWSVSGIDTKNGFKVTYSKTSTVPAYGTDSAKFVDGAARSVNLALQDGKTWHIRVCRYDGDGKCSYYSNTVSVAAPYKEVAKVTLGSSTATLTESTLSWTFTGTAPYGFKVVWNTSGSATYPTSGSNAGAQYVSSGSSLNLSEVISGTGSYKVRVCKYTNGTEASACLDYSNEVTYVKS